MIDDSSGLINLDSMGSDLLIIPRGRPGLSPLKMDLGDIRRIADRLPEIKRATAMTLADLIVDFNIGLLRLAKAISIVDLELKEAEMQYKEVKSMAILEKIELILKDKGVKSTSDTREAAMYLDPAVKEARGRMDLLTVVSTYLRDQHHAFELAYNGAKKICDIHMKSPSATYSGGNQE
jgi:hypothetical protein